MQCARKRVMKRSMHTKQPPSDRRCVVPPHRSGARCGSRVLILFLVIMNLLVLSKSTERRALEAEEGGGGSNIVSSGPKTKTSVSSSSRRQQQPPPVSKHPQQTRPKKVPLVLLASVDGTVTAVKANTGSKIWSIELGGPLLSSWENRTIFNGSMIIPNTDGSLYVTTSTGRVQRVPVSVQELVSASPFMADDGSLYVAKKVSQFFVVDRSTGKVLRQVDADIEDMLEDESKITGEKTSSRHNQILLGRYEFQVKCMHPETHEISWKASLSYFPNVAALDGGADEEVSPPKHFSPSFAFSYFICILLFNFTLNFTTSF